MNVLNGAKRLNGLNDLNGPAVVNTVGSRHRLSNQDIVVVRLGSRSPGVATLYQESIVIQPIENRPCGYP